MLGLLARLTEVSDVRVLVCVCVCVCMCVCACVCLCVDVLISIYRVAKTHRMPYLYRSFSAKEPYH